VVVVLGSLVVAWRATSALNALKPRYDAGRHLQNLERLAQESEKWLKLADRTNGFKAAIFGIVGVLLGVMGGLSADWVAHGIWDSNNTVRAGCVVLVVMVVSVAAFGLIHKWRPSRVNDLEGGD